MSQEVLFATGDPVNVKCFTFQNPSSINGPFGSFQLWIDGSNILGRMTIGTLFALGSTKLLNLEGTSSGTNSIVCTLQGKGFSTQRLNQFDKPLYAELGLTVTFASDWSTGSLIFSAATPEDFGGLPVTSVACPSLSDLGGAVESKAG